MRFQVQKGYFFVSYEISRTNYTLLLLFIFFFFSIINRLVTPHRHSTANVIFSDLVCKNRNEDCHENNEFLKNLTFSKISNLQNLTNLRFSKIIFKFESGFSLIWNFRKLWKICGFRKFWIIWNFRFFFKFDVF